MARMEMEISALEARAEAKRKSAEKHASAQSALERELSQRRKLVLVITHDFELIQSACTRVLVLREGKLVADLSGEGRTKIREIWKE